MASWFAYLVKFITKKGEIPEGKEIETKGDFDLLPEDCIARIASLSTPRNACVSSLVSSAFRSAADSDIVWERFLPSDYGSFLSRAVHPVQYASKKELYLRLCDHPIQIDGGKLSFRLEKSTGAKCFIIPARKLNTTDSLDESSWKLFPISDSRFPEATAKLLLQDGDGDLLTLSGKIESRYLAPDTTYASYLILKSTRTGGSKQTEIYDESDRECGVGLLRKNPNKKCWFPLEVWRCAKQRSNGWMEIEMKEHYSENWENKEVAIRLHIYGNILVNYPVFLGLELMPKKV